ncbi:MAG: phosphate/phosphite/phosphonate ABC transporter substrate-binding protein [Nitrospirota bacterium]
MNKKSFEFKCMAFITLLLAAGVLWAYLFVIFSHMDLRFRVVVLVLGIFIIAFVTRSIIRKFIILPMQSIEKAIKSMADRDLTSRVDIQSDDEIGRLGKAFNESLHSIASIFRRVKNESGRVSEVAIKVETQLKNVSENSRLESEAVANIASSLEQMNSASIEITQSTESLATVTEEKAVSLEEMVTSISQVANSAQELSGTVDSTSASIEELSATIKEVADKAEELSAASEETLTATEEIFSSIKEVEQSAKESAKLSEKVKIDASTFGLTSVEKTVEGIQNIKTSFEKTATFMKRLSGRSQEIGKILNVIDEITDQTTLLALNAAILAAQAGEHGRSFSVVADEIKDLAERTSLSTREIAELIQSVQQEVKAATSAMDEGLASVEEGLKVASYAGDALKKIVESSRQSAEMSLAIERSTAEQAKTTKIVSDSMEKVKNMVAQVAKATTEQSKGARLITKATEKMRDVSNHVKSATAEQLINIKQISESIDLVSEKSRQIAKAVYEQGAGSGQIFASIEKIREVPKKTIDAISDINQSLEGLFRNYEVVSTELRAIKLPGESGTTTMDMINFGIEPFRVSPSEMQEKFKPLVEYLANKTGKKMELRVASDYKGAIADIGTGVTQICFMTPTSYAEANKKFGVEALARTLVDGKPTYRSAVITRANGGIETLKALKGHSFAFGDPHSLSHYVAPRVMLLESGIDLKDLLYYEYLSSDEEIVNAVAQGRFDAGGLSLSAVNGFRDATLRTIKISEDLPGSVICANKNISEKEKLLIKSVLVELTNASHEGSAILRSIYSRYTSFEEASDEDYAIVKGMMSKIGMI